MNCIKNLLTEGIPAKIYLGAFGMETTAYELSKIMPHSQSKINEWRNKMGNKFFIIKKTHEVNRPKIYFKSKIRPLIKEIEKQIGYIGNEDRIRLKKLLGSDFMKNYIINFNKIRDFSKKINAVEEITNILGIMCILTLGIYDYFDNIANLKTKDGREISWRQVVRKLTKGSQRKKIDKTYSRIKKDTKRFDNYPIFKKYYPDFEKRYKENVSELITVFTLNDDAIEEFTNLIPDGMKEHSGLIASLSMLTVEMTAMIEQYRLTQSFVTK